MKDIGSQIVAMGCLSPSLLRSMALLVRVSVVPDTRTFPRNRLKTSISSSVGEGFRLTEWCEENTLTPSPYPEAPCSHLPFPLPWRPPPHPRFSPVFSSSPQHPPQPSLLDTSTNYIHTFIRNFISPPSLLDTFTTYPSFFHRTKSLSTSLVHHSRFLHTTTVQINHHNDLLQAHHLPPPPLSLFDGSRLSSTSLSTNDGTKDERCQSWWMVAHGTLDYAFDLR